MRLIGMKYEWNIGVIQCMENGILKRFKFLVNLGMWARKVIKKNHYVEEKASQTEPIDIFTWLTFNIVFSHSQESAF